MLARELVVFENQDALAYILHTLQFCIVPYLLLAQWFSERTGFWERSIHLLASITCSNCWTNRFQQQCYVNIAQHNTKNIDKLTAITGNIKVNFSYEMPNISRRSSVSDNIENQNTDTKRWLVLTTPYGLREIYNFIF